MKTRYLFPILSIFAMAGCANFLDEQNPSNFTKDNYFKTPEHARSVVNAIYQDFRLGANGDYGGNPYFMTDFQTGLAGTHVGQNVNINKVRTLSNDSDNQYSLSWWNTSYRAIANANLAIEKIPGIQMDETEKAKDLGEAYFLRAYHYFNLVRMFGDVPLIVVPIDASSPELYPEQVTIDNIYSQIVKDLQEAEKSGLPWTDNSGKVTMSAIKALFAEVYLTMAGYPLNKGNEYNKLAAQKAKELIDEGCCSLFDSYDKLHDIEYENKGEHILMAQYKSSIINNSMQNLYLPFSLDISKYDTEPGSMYAVPEFIASYEAGDKRVEDHQFYYTTFSSNTDRNLILNLGDTYIYKFFDLDAHLNTAQSGLNYPLIRYAQVLLTYAEAENEADGAPSALAYKCINAIRSRANLSDLTGLSQSQFREAVWTERYHELAYENKIWFDMARTRKALNLSNGKYEDFVGHRFTYGNLSLSEKELLFPIPISELNNNHNLKQNPGY